MKLGRRMPDEMGLRHTKDEPQATAGSIQVRNLIVQHLQRLDAVKEVVSQPVYRSITLMRTARESGKVHAGFISQSFL